MHPSESDCSFIKLVHQLYLTKSWSCLQQILSMTIASGSPQCREYLKEIFLEMCCEGCKDGITAMMEGAFCPVTASNLIATQVSVISGDIADVLRKHGVVIRSEFTNVKSVVPGEKEETESIENPDKVNCDSNDNAVKTSEVNHDSVSNTTVVCKANEFNTTTHTVGDKSDSLQDEEKTYNAIMEKYNPKFVIMKNLMNLASEYATSLNDLKVVLKRCTPEELQSQEMYELMHVACRELTDNVVQAMIDGGVSPNIRSVNGKNLLHELSSTIYIDTVKLLLDAGFNLFDTPEMGDVFISACAKGNNELVKYMLDKGVPVNVRASDNSTGLMYAIHRGYECIVKLLIGAGALMYVDAGDHAWYKSWNIGNIFTRACQKGDNDFVRLMLDRGVPVDIRASNNRTGLMYAAQKGHYATVDLLLKAGADILLKCDSDKTPAQWSQDFRCTEMIQRAEAVAAEKDRFGLSEEDYNKLRMSIAMEERNKMESELRPKIKAEIKNEILDKVRNALSLA